MAAITSSTGSSGLPIDSIVQGLMTVAKQPVNQVQSQIAAQNTKLSAYGTLKSGLSTFQTAVDKLATQAKFNAQTTKFSQAESMTVTADGTATNGNHTIAITQLASSHRLATAAYPNTSTALGTGKLTISFGTFTPANVTTAASFTDNTSKTAITIDIDSTNNTLAGIRDAINAKNASVSATIVNDGSGNRLVITSKDTGEVNSLKIDVTDGDGNNTDGNGLSALAYNPLATAGSGQNLTQLEAAKNALLTVDGLSISKPSNTMTDVIQGATLNIKAVTNGNATLNIATDTETIQASVQGFVDAFNKLNTSLRDLTKFVAGGSKANGPLLGDPLAREVQVKMRSLLSAQSPTATTFRNLRDIGITINEGGVMSMDASKLQTAMNTNATDVAKLFAPSATTTDPLVSFVGSSAKTASGTYAINLTQAGASGQSITGTMNGVAGIGSGTTLTGATGQPGAGLRLNITGTQTGDRGTVTFSQGLAGELSSLLTKWLESDSALNARTEGIQSSIKTLNKRVDDLNARLPALESRYRAQYAKLDALLSGMQNKSSYLNQQFAALSKNTG